MMPLPSVLDEIDRLFEELITQPWGTQRQFVPAEVKEVEDGWMVSLPVPDLSPADLQVQVQGKRLTITGSRRRAHQQHGRGAWTRTQHEISFQRSIMLPDGADPDHIDAKIQNATLFIHIRRRQP